MIFLFSFFHSVTGAGDEEDEDSASQRGGAEALVGEAAGVVVAEALVREAVDVIIAEHLVRESVDVIIAVNLVREPVDVVVAIGLVGEAVDKVATKSLVREAVGVAVAEVLRFEVGVGALCPRVGRRCHHRRQRQQEHGKFEFFSCSIFHRHDLINYHATKI